MESQAQTTQRKNGNPYKHMSLEELKAAILNSAYQGMSIKELKFTNHRLAQALETLKTDEGKRIITQFCDEGLLKKVKHPTFHFDKSDPQTVMDEVRAKYTGNTSTELAQEYPALAIYLRRTHLDNGQSLMRVLVEEGTLKRGSKSHANQLMGHRNLWNRRNSGFRTCNEYMQFYLHRRSR